MHSGLFDWLQELTDEQFPAALERCVTRTCASARCDGEGMDGGEGVEGVDDCLVAVAVLLWSRRDRFADLTSEERPAYLLTCTRHEVRRLLRRARRREVETVDLGVAEQFPDVTTSNQPMAKELHEAVDRPALVETLDSLRPAEYRLLDAFYFQQRIHGQGRNSLHFANKTLLVSTPGLAVPAGYTATPISTTLANGQLAKIRVMVLAGCDSGGGSGGLITQLKAKGAQMVIGLSRTINANVAAWWCDLFWKFLTQGKDANPLQYMGPAGAADLAHKETLRKFRGNLIGGFDNGVDDFLIVE